MKAGGFHVQIKDGPGAQELRNSHFQLKSKGVQNAGEPSLSQIIVLAMINNGLTLMSAHLTLAWISMKFELEN